MSRWIRDDAKFSMVDGGGLNGAGRNSRWNALNSLTLPLVCLVTRSVVGVVAVFKRRMPSSIVRSNSRPQNRFESGAGHDSGNKEARSLYCGSGAASLLSK